MIERVIRAQGTVAHKLPNTRFKVQIDGGLELLAHASEKPVAGKTVWRFR